MEATDVSITDTLPTRALIADGIRTLFEESWATHGSVRIVKDSDVQPHWVNVPFPDEWKRDTPTGTKTKYEMRYFEERYRRFLIEMLVAKTETVVDLMICQHHGFDFKTVDGELQGRYQMICRGDEKKVKAAYRITLTIEIDEIIDHCCFDYKIWFVPPN